MGKIRMAPPTQVVGVFRYKQIIGRVYIRFNEHTRKVSGLATPTAIGEFTTVGLDTLIKEVNESERQSRGKGR